MADGGRCSLNAARVREAERLSQLSKARLKTSQGFA
jgi:hypothetical protein